MTVLAALARHYERLAAKGETPVAGYSAEKIAFAITIDAQGQCRDVRDLRKPERGKPRPALHVVPQPVKRTVQIAPNLLWDKTSYALGVTAVDAALPAAKAERARKRTAEEHAAFKKRQHEVFEKSDDPGLRAFLTFLDAWEPEQYEDKFSRYAEEMRDSNVVFELDGPDEPFLHDRPAARAIVAGLAASSDAASGLCLVTGERRPIARLHPSIKGVRGAQSSGAAIVSFNQAAFTSYGKDQGENAPVSEATTFAYTTALNALLADERRRIQIGDATVASWVEIPPTADDAMAAAANAVADLFASSLGGDGKDAESRPDEGNEDRRLLDYLAAVEAGRPLPGAGVALDPRTRFFVLGLSPNAARLSVRFWLDTTVGALAQRLQQHYADLRLEPLPWKAPPAMWRLLYELAPQRKAENVPAHLSGELTRAILTGGPYPFSLLSLTLTRLRADHDVTGLRAALIKATLSRRHMEVPVSLDREECNVGYRLGRLFAVFEAAQYAGVGKVNATVRDRYVGAASATPGRVFPLLLRGTQDHLSAAKKKNRIGRAIRLEKEISQIVGGLPPGGPFPPALDLDDQGRFFVGFYHQQADLFTRRTPEEAGDDDTDTEE